MNDPNHARFLTFSTNHRLDLFGTAALRDVFSQQLKRSKDRHGFLLYAWVLMPNHAHLFIREPINGEVKNILRSLKSPVARTILAKWKKLDAPILDRLADSQGKIRFWLQGGGYDRNIVSDDEFDEKIRYIHQNPVRANLVEHDTDWAWSSAR